MYVVTKVNLGTKFIITLPLNTPIYDPLAC